MAVPITYEPEESPPVEPRFSEAQSESKKRRPRKKKNAVKEEEDHADYETTKETMKLWMKETGNASIVYGSLLRKSNRNLRRTLLLSFILSGIMMGICTSTRIMMLYLPFLFFLFSNKSLFLIH